MFYLFTLNTYSVPSLFLLTPPYSLSIMLLFLCSSSTLSHPPFLFSSLTFSAYSLQIYLSVSYCIFIPSLFLPIFVSSLTLSAHLPEFISLFISLFLFIKVFMFIYQSLSLSPSITLSVYHSIFILL